MKKRAFVMLLVSVLLLSVISSCGETGNASVPEENQTDVQTDYIQDDSSSNTDEYGRDIIASGLPEDLDLGGKTVTFYLRPDFNGVQTAYELLGV